MEVATGVSSWFWTFITVIVVFFGVSRSVFRQVNRVLYNEHKQHFGWV